MSEPHTAQSFNRAARRALNRATVGAALVEFFRAVRPFLEDADRERERREEREAYAESYRRYRALIAARHRGILGRLHRRGRYSVNDLRVIADYASENELELVQIREGERPRVFPDVVGGLLYLLSVGGWRFQCRRTGALYP